MKCFFPFHRGYSALVFYMQIIANRESQSSTTFFIAAQEQEDVELSGATVSGEMSRSEMSSSSSAGGLDLSGNSQWGNGESIPVIEGMKPLR